jgi:hypothetical protein
VKAIPSAARVSAALDKPYSECETRADFLFIALDALDQAGAPLSVQAAVRAVLTNWDRAATNAARDAVEKVTT